MGVKVYWFIVVLVLVCAIVIPQTEKSNRKLYVVLMAFVHTFVSGFRYKYLTGDLLNYADDFYRYRNLGWFDESVFQGGRNVGYLWLMKFISGITNGNFQVFLFVTSLVIEIGVAILIYKYSPKPWLSYVVWNCMSFYIFGFSAVKQALAMGILTFAMDALLEKKAMKFYIFVILAGLIHAPALVLLPAYYISKFQLSERSIFAYILLAFVLFLQRGAIVNNLADVYYENTSFGNLDAGLGGRFLMIVVVLITGFILKGFRDVKYSKIYCLTIIAGILQMFSGFDNIFTRLADYYWQWSILLIPMMFSDFSKEEEMYENQAYPMMYFNERSLKMLCGILIVVLVWWYYKTCLGATIAYSVDDYLNFRFMWEV